MEFLSWKMHEAISYLRVLQTASGFRSLELKVQRSKNVRKVGNLDLYLWNVDWL